MRYFYNKELGRIVMMDGEGKIYVFEEVKAGNVAAGAGGGVVVKKRRGGRPKKSDDLSDLAEPDAPRSRLMPETLNAIKDRLKQGIPVAAIHDELGVSAPTIYKIKNDLNL